jgi:serine/threonine-protein kinase
VALASGTRLGPYEVIAQIDAGGMGEVYKARDTRLDRLVAIKVLPPSIADNPLRRDRFDREARIISSLNHPHICTLYDVGHQDGDAYLVMELIDAQTLAERLAKGALPLQQAIEYAIQIAQALDAAHRCGIVHRDLKPTNVMLTKAGVKLLDFGIAKMTASVATVSSTLTAEGTLVGTLHYMAPEQLEGREADARIDIFALGAVMFEMLTGTRAFAGESPSKVIASVLDSVPPSVSSIRRVAPVALDHLVATCLAKNPEDRWQDASDVARVLQGIAAENRPALPPPSERRRHQLYAASGVTIGAVVGIAVGVLTMHGGWRDRSGTLPRTLVERFTENLSPGDQLAPSPALAIAPDGRRVAYVVVANGKRQLYVRDFDTSSAQLLPGTQDADQPFFSPDGLSIGFFAEGTLKRVSVSGGLPVTLCNAGSPRGGSWAADGTIVFAPSPASPLWAIPASGGKPRVISALDLTLNEAGHRWPHVLPDGDAVLFGAGPSTSVFAWTEAHIVVQSLKTGARRVVVAHGTYPHYISGGTMLYLQDGVAYTQAFDSTTLETSGAPALAFADVDLGGLNAGSAQFDVSSTGSLVYGSAPPRTPQPLVWVDRRGTEQLLPFPAAAYSTPRISPDGRYVAVTVRSGSESDVWVLDTERGTSARVTFGGINMWPLWAPDGERLTYASRRNGSTNTFMTRVGSGESAVRLTSDSRGAFPLSWSPDETSLALTKLAESGRLSIWILPVAGGTPTLFHDGVGRESEPAFSPDGRRVAYMSNETGRNEIYVRPYPGPGAEIPISVAGGEEPVWARNGELFYKHDDEMMVVDLAAGLHSIGTPARLFAGNYARAGVMPAYDVARDGRRLLMVKAPPGARDPSRFAVVLNWQATLKSSR